jgi:hypothetical protein
MESGIHGCQACGLHHGEALGAEALAIEQQLWIATTAAEVTDEMQTIHSPTPQKAKAQLSGQYTRAAPSIRALFGARLRSLIALNSCKTS